MAVDFSNLLTKPVDTIERPPVLPAGHYFGSVAKYEFGESSQKKTPYLRVHVQLHSPDADIDPESIAKIDLSKRTLRSDFFLTEDALYRLKDFLISCEVKTEGRTLNEVIPEIINAQVKAQVTITPSQDGSDFYNNIKTLSGV